jgi:RsiW-degrading membrane proteinase PrsW (M82 family)
LNQPNYPPPPPSGSYPPPPPLSYSPIKKGLHGPETRFFLSIRAYLTRLEQYAQGYIGNNLKKGLIAALILGATLSFALSYVAQLATGVTGTDPALIIVIAPLTEEIFKGLSVLLAVFFLWKIIPNRRYGALIGAAAGLGFSIAENLLYSINYASLGDRISAGYMAELILMRWVGMPFMHVLWSAFIGIGVFVFLAQRRNSYNTPQWLPILFFLLGLFNHMLWNTMSLLAGSVTNSPFVILLIDVLVVFVIFALMFRDLLGSHFNFQNFLQPVKEPNIYQQTGSFPPPPPPPPSQWY